MGKTKIKTIDDSLRPEDSGQAARKEKPSTHPSFGGKKKVKEIVIASEAKQSSTSDEITSPEKIATATPEGGPRDDKKGKPQKPGKAKPRSKKYQEVAKDLDRSKSYPITEAVDMVKKLNYAKFNATIEAHINTAALGIRGFLSLPYASGKKLRILIFGHLPEPSEYEGVIFGDDSTIETISQGKVDFDLVITTPEWMPKLTKVARILGPRGLMPNPKNGTITSGEDGLKKAVESFQAGKTEYKTEPKAPVIHLGVGKLNQPTEELSANIKTLLQTLGKTRIKKVSLSPTMGPSVKVDLTDI